MKFTNKKSLKRSWWLLHFCFDDIDILQPVLGITFPLLSFIYQIRVLLPSETAPVGAELPKGPFSCASVVDCLWICMFFLSFGPWGVGTMKGLRKSSFPWAFHSIRLAPSVNCTIACNYFCPLSQVVFLRPSYLSKLLQHLRCSVSFSWRGSHPLFQYFLPFDI